MPVFTKLPLVFAVFCGGALLAATGCSSEHAGEEEQAAEVEGAWTGTRSVDLKYEGTCEFLRTCSTWSRNFPAGEVSWGCTGRGVCEDDALWVAGPNRSYCGKTVQICRKGTCTNALVKDVSVSKDWEASNGVLNALDIDYGLTGKCAGFGGGRVEITVGDGSSAPPSKGGCSSATLGRSVANLACVQQADGDWFQCRNGDWFRGVANGKGSGGECSSMHRY